MFLLPSHDQLDYFTFAATYVFACILGVASNAPGGIGVFEAAMLKAVPISLGRSAACVAGAVPRHLLSRAISLRPRVPRRPREFSPLEQFARGHAPERGRNRLGG